MKKENVEVIEMQQTTFVQRHAKKILFATGVVVAAGAYYIHKKYNIEMEKVVTRHSKEIGKLRDELTVGGGIIQKITNRELTRVTFEIKALEQYINNLDPEININKFVNIPNAKERLMELYLELEEINKDSIVLSEYAK